MGNHNIKIYSTPWCVYCKMAKDFLDQKGIKYEDINVEGDHAMQEEMIHKSGQLGVPVIDIDGKIFVGFDKRGISEVLGIK